MPAGVLGIMFSMRDDVRDIRVVALVVVVVQNF